MAGPIGMTANVFELFVVIRTGREPKIGVIRRFSRREIMKARDEALSYIAADPSTYEKWMTRHFHRKGVILRVESVWEIKRKLIA
jgi:hypothetical protein